MQDIEDLVVDYKQGQRTRSSNGSAKIAPDAEGTGERGASPFTGGAMTPKIFAPTPPPSLSPAMNGKDSPSPALKATATGNINPCDGSNGNKEAGPLNPEEIYPGIGALYEVPSKPLYEAHEIERVHLELTDKCNAACPQCQRNVDGGATNPLLPLTELSLAQIQAMFPVPFLQQLKKITMCGNYGDPVQCKDLLGIIRYFRAANPRLRLGLHTNGGARGEAYWRELGGLLREPSYVRFAVDGLEDTNHLYRQGVAWPALVAHLRAAVAAGARAEWDFLVFRHNEHQVEAARALAKQLGVKRFQAKATSRFLDRSAGVPDGERLRRATPVRGPDGEVVRHLELPRRRRWQNRAALKGLQAVTKLYGSLDSYYSSCGINCKVQRSKEIYVSAEGYVFPCCWLQGSMYNQRLPARRREAVRLVEAAHPGEGLAALSLLHRPVAEVLASPFYARLLTASWRQPLGGGRVKTCAQVCGSELDAFQAQFENRRDFQQLVRQKMGDAAHRALGVFRRKKNKAAREEEQQSESLKRVQKICAVVYSSLTGTAEEVAKSIQSSMGGEALTLNISELKHDLMHRIRSLGGIIIFVVATTGEGEFIEDAKPFIQAQGKAQKDTLKGLKVAMCGLGSTFYDKFNNAGKMTLQLLKDFQSTSRLFDFLDFLDKGAEEICSPVWLDAAQFGKSMPEQMMPWFVSDLSPALIKLADSVEVTEGIELRDESKSSSKHRSPHEAQWERSKTLTVLSNDELRQNTENGSTKLIIFRCPDDFSFQTCDNIGVFPDAPAAAGAPFPRPRYYTAASAAAATTTNNDRAAGVGVEEGHRRLALVVTEVPGGACSPYLAARRPGQTVRAFSKTSTFSIEAAIKARIALRQEEGGGAPPPPPLLLVAAGSGLAPALGLLEERAAAALRGPGGGGGGGGEVRLYFGCRGPAEDFLCRELLESYVAEGVITALITAFSRDNNRGKKFYVQDALEEDGAAVRRAARAGAAVFVCGRAAMGQGVRRALRTVLTKEKGGEDTYTALMGEGSGEEERNNADGSQSARRYFEELWG